MYVNSFKQFLHRGFNRIFVAGIRRVTTLLLSNRSMCVC